MLSLLPSDGTPVLNRVMRMMLARELEQPITQERFFQARDLLLKKRLVGRLRGQGGQIFLSPEVDPTTPNLNEVPTSLWPEAKLMEPLKRFLEGSFAQSLDLPSDGVCIVHETASFGPHRGLWARPDFVLVSGMRFKLMPGAQVDVHSFELKTEAGCTVQSVHEALAQTRFTHFGHLVWHLPEKSKAEARYAEIEEHCHAHGIGLIRMRNPTDPKTYEVVLDPERKRTLPSVVEGFLESRLTTPQRKRLSLALDGSRS